MVNVCDIQVMKPLLAQHGFHFSKAKGQNFLIAPWVPQSIAEEAGVELEMTPIGKEGFVFFVSEENPVDGLTSGQIRRKR